jgi:uncharacterized protein
MIEETIIQFFTVLWHYILEIVPYLALGFLISGIINEYVPAGWVEKHLGGKGIKPILYSTIAGTALPICCIGSLPVAVSLHQKGARLGPVLAFLVATPATSVSALLVVYALLGIKFTIYIFFAVIFMGVIAGLIGNMLRVTPRECPTDEDIATDPVCGMRVPTATSPSTEHKGLTYYFCCPHCRQAFEEKPEEFTGKVPQANFKHRARHILRYAFVEQVREIGPEIVLGLALAALVASVTPIGRFVGEYFAGIYGYIFGLVFGMIMYICSTASVPLVDALTSQGMNIGAGMMLLLIGPITSMSTILVIRKEFGMKTLAVYLLIISASSLALGFLFTLL